MKYFRVHILIIFYFLGLNSLSKSEEFIINYLLENNNSKIYWDCEENYIENKDHSLDIFRKYLNEWPYYLTHSFKWQLSNLNEKKNISVYETSKRLLR